MTENSRQLASQGFNLVELLIVIAISSVLLTVGVPAFDSFFVTMRNDRLIDGLHSALSLARSEAIKSGRDAIVCAGSSSCTNSDEWTAGWIVTVTTIAGANGTMLRAWPSAPDGYQVQATSEIRFKPSGQTAAGVTQAISVNGDDSASCIYVSPVGQVNIVKGGCS